MLLGASGFDISLFENIDEIDAALCARAAQSFLRGDFKAYGDDSAGFIIVPANPLSAVATLTFPTPKSKNFGGAWEKVLEQLPFLTAAERVKIEAAITELRKERLREPLLG